MMKSKQKSNSIISKKIITKRIITKSKRKRSSRANLKNQVVERKHWGRKKERKKNIVGDKPEFLLVYGPHIHGKEV
jgi:hypothetical protein